jgi:DNA-binding beta-propeller fold protein YncE
MGRPSEIWVDPADNEVFVADGYGNRRIIVFDGATGKYLRHWGAYGRRPEDPPPSSTSSTGSTGSTNEAVPAAPHSIRSPAGYAGR